MIPSGKPNEIWRIVRPIHLIRRLKKGILQEHRENLKISLLETQLNCRQNPTAEVPKGFLAVYVGPEKRRFVIPASYLCLPIFKDLMERVAEEFGFEQTGGLRIPCEEDVFEEMLVCLENDQKKKQKKMMTKVLYPLNHS